MRLLVLSLAAAVAAATPAFADETRVEIDTGLNWGSGYGTNATLGGRVGEDFGLGPGAFTGVEASVDKVLASGYDASVSLTGRLGLKPTPKDKLYALAGYTFSSSPADATHLGVGWEHDLMHGVYGSVEYRHFFTNDGWPDSNTLTAGVGLHF